MQWSHNCTVEVCEINQACSDVPCMPCSTGIAMPVAACGDEQRWSGQARQSEKLGSVTVHNCELGMGGQAYEEQPVWACSQARVGMRVGHGRCAPP